MSARFPTKSVTTGVSLPLRPIRYTSKFYLELTLRIWHLLLLSIPLDLLFLEVPFQLPRNIGAINACRGFMLVCILLCVLGIFRFKMFELFLKADEFQSKLLKFAKDYRVLTVLLLVFGVFIEVLIKIGNAAVSSIVIALVIAIGAFRALENAVKKYRMTREELSQDRSLWIEKTNQIVFSINMLPLGAARLLSICAGLLFLQGEVSTTFLLSSLVTGLAFVLFFEPREENFQIYCKGCAQRTSLALYSDGYCPVCLARIRK